MTELNGCIYAYTIRIYYAAMLYISATYIWIMLNAKRIAMHSAKAMNSVQYACE